MKTHFSSNASKRLHKEVRGAHPILRDTVIGLRVRWQWTHAHMRQAPDTREFRIYYHPDPMNALLGRTRNVSSAGSTESEVETDIVNIHPTNAYAGHARSALHVSE